jgi:hypothetical protein
MTYQPFHVHDRVQVVSSGKTGVIIYRYMESFTMRYIVKLDDLSECPSFADGEIVQEREDHVDS